MKKHVAYCLLLVACCLLHSTHAGAVSLNFEDLTDLTSVNDFYASNGVHFQNALSLTAGFSLNEFDFPPSSGSVAVGDDNAPVEIIFDNPTSNIFAHFTYSSQLTFSAYDNSGALIGSYTNPLQSNLGNTELIGLGFSNVASLVIAGATVNSFIMDDFNFTQTVNPVPEPSTMALLGLGLIGLIGNRIRNQRHNNG